MKIKKRLIRTIQVSQSLTTVKFFNTIPHAGFVSMYFLNFIVKLYFGTQAKSVKSYKKSEQYKVNKSSSDFDWG